MTVTAFKSMGLPKKPATEAELDSYVKERGVPVLVHEGGASEIVPHADLALASTAPALPSVDAKSGISRRLSVQIPDYLWRTLKVEAGTRGCTVRYLILEALRKNGSTIADEDFSEDGRREA